MLTRREYLRLTALGSMALTLPIPLLGAKKGSTRRQDLVELSEELLISWCQGMLEHQVVESNDPTDYGGLMSPGDGRILGRCADAVYPFLWCARKQDDERFVKAAVEVVNWSLHNVSFPDGSWKNGVNDSWRGITVFIAIALAQAVHYHGDILDVKVKAAWVERLRKTGNWLHDTIHPNFANINYPMSNSFAMALLGQVLDEPKFTKRGRELAHAMLAWFTEKDGLLFGEGRNNKAFKGDRSPKGCYPIDLGYNVEESLPALALYGLLEQDERVLKRVTASLRVHLDFMLPDGGWDNSWGTRNFKWTWWGSRTADGCQPAYALLADRDPTFLEAAYRNTRLLEQCTKDGVLYGGPHYISRGVRPSLHHTFCHAKALATVLDSGVPAASESYSHLPCEKPYGIKSFPDIYTWLICHGPWRATITGYDFPYKRVKGGHASGGALSVLWHKDAGPLVSASMSIYQLVERHDMQQEAGPGFGTLTPRVQLMEQESSYLDILYRFIDNRLEKKTYMNILDLGADVATESLSNRMLVKTKSRLLDVDQEPPERGNVTCLINYYFLEHAVEIEVAAMGDAQVGNLAYILPIVSTHAEVVHRDSEKAVSIIKGRYRVRVSSDQTMSVPESSAERVFSYVPGFEVFPISFPLKENLKLRIDVTNA